MAEAAMRPDLYGKVRPDKPWLDYLPRTFFVSDMADALSGEIVFGYLKQEIVDVVSSAPRPATHLVVVDQNAKAHGRVRAVANE